MTYEELLKLTEEGIEIWKPIPEFEGCYEISNLGNVKSLDREIIKENRTINVKGRIKKSFIDTQGYRVIMLCKNGIPRVFGLHRLLAKAFIPNPEDKPEIDHINTNRADCNLKNLRWVTHKENNNNIITMQNKRKNTYAPEVCKRRLKTRKEKNSNFAPISVYQYTKDGVFIKSYYSISEAVRETKIKHIYDVINNNSRSAGGYIWTNFPSNNIKYKKRDPDKRHILQYDKEGNIVKEWNSIAEASNTLGIPYNSILTNLNATYSLKHNFKYKKEAI